MDETTVEARLAEAQRWVDRASLAEDELTALRREIRSYVATLRQPLAGPVVWRSEVADTLASILA